MDKGINKEKYRFDCDSCIFLDKSRKQISDNGFCYRYGCNSRMKDRFICGWLVNGRNDRELRTMGCSDRNKLKVGMKFNIKSRFDENKKESWLYCGKVNGRYLCYKVDTNLYVYKLFDKGQFRGQTGKLISTFEIIEQNETQFEASKRVAKKRRRKYIEKNGKNII